MKEKEEKKGFIIPYAFNVGGNLLGDPAANITGMPLFLTEEQEEKPQDL